MCKWTLIFVIQEPFDVLKFESLQTRRTDKGNNHIPGGERYFLFLGCLGFPVGL